MDYIEEYIKKYCTKHETTPEAARTHATVKEAVKYYEAVERGKIKATEGTVNAAEMGECK